MPERDLGGLGYALAAGTALLVGAVGFVALRGRPSPEPPASEPELASPSTVRPGRERAWMKLPSDSPPPISRPGRPPLDPLAMVDSERQEDPASEARADLPPPEDGPEAPRAQADPFQGRRLGSSVLLEEWRKPSKPAYAHPTRTDGRLAAVTSGGAGPGAPPAEPSSTGTGSGSGGTSGARKLRAVANQNIGGPISTFANVQTAKFEETTDGTLTKGNKPGGIWSCANGLEPTWAGSVQTCCAAGRYFNTLAGTCCPSAAACKRQNPDGDCIATSLGSRGP